MVRERSPSSLGSRLGAPPAAAMARWRIRSAAATPRETSELRQREDARRARRIG